MVKKKTGKKAIKRVRRSSIEKASKTNSKMILDKINSQTGFTINMNIRDFKAEEHLDTVEFSKYLDEKGFSLCYEQEIDPEVRFKNYYIAFYKHKSFKEKAPFSGVKKIVNEFVLFRNEIAPCHINAKRYMGFGFLFTLEGKEYWAPIPGSVLISWSLIMNRNYMNMYMFELFSDLNTRANLQKVVDMNEYDISKKELDELMSEIFMEMFRFPVGRAGDEGYTHKLMTYIMNVKNQPTTLLDLYKIIMAGIFQNNTLIGLQYQTINPSGNSKIITKTGAPANTYHFNIVLSRIMDIFEKKICEINGIEKKSINYLGR